MAVPESFERDQDESPFERPPVSEGYPLDKEEKEKLDESLRKMRGESPKPPKDPIDWLFVALCTIMETREATDAGLEAALKSREYWFGRARDLLAEEDGCQCPSCVRNRTFTQALLSGNTEVASNCYNELFEQAANLEQENAYLKDRLETKELFEWLKKKMKQLSKK